MISVWRKATSSGYMVTTSLPCIVEGNVSEAKIRNFFIIRGLFDINRKAKLCRFLNLKVTSVLRIVKINMTVIKDFKKYQVLMFLLE